MFLPSAGAGESNPPWKTHHRRNVRAAARQFNHRRAAKTIANGRDCVSNQRAGCRRSASRPALARARNSCRSFLYLPAWRRLPACLRADALAVNVGAKTRRNRVARASPRVSFRNPSTQPLMPRSGCRTFCPGWRRHSDESFECRVARLYSTIWVWMPARATPAQARTRASSISFSITSINKPKIGEMPGKFDASGVSGHIFATTTDYDVSIDGETCL